MCCCEVCESVVCFESDCWVQAAFLPVRRCTVCGIKRKGAGYALEQIGVLGSRKCDGGSELADIQNSHCCCWTSYLHVMLHSTMRC